LFSKKKSIVDDITLIVSSQRSGSTLLCRDIESMSGMGSPEEYFTYFFQERSKINKIFKRYNENDVIKRIGKGCIASEPNIGAVKLMVDQAPRVDSLIREDIPLSRESSIENIVNWSFSKFRRVNLIFITRNVIDQSISRAMTKHTNIWHYELDSSKHKNQRWVDNRPDFNLDLSEETLSLMILSELQNVILESNIIRRVFKKYSNNSILIDYESLSYQPKDCWRKITSHAKKLGFKPKKETAERSLQKLISIETNLIIKEKLKSYILKNFD
tara:strand:+ start:580 stop:1395 length:816 start_codon:yes stop_codon:yes gene_type:complete